ncbi:ATP-binding protein [Petrotoga sp. 9PWA.NaAc.5.4]|uniref:ATP-binding protein n=1 Tax=Petrotoga sp. 9PWA.NaAc.5.4 TaxID=1434328 RepID=UPI000CA78DCE|nr:ATP-binding protein [Petrotoga sp. 9PWA.NaAc.5.4]PNR94645.1 ATP-binding protein [Petrotoga sp. 9PWA.NaAc.5.4]
MSNYIKLQNNLEELNLNEIKNNLDKYLNLVKEGEKSFVDALYELSSLEIKAKEKRAMYSCVRIANFPFLKGVEDFDFAFQPGINKQEILENRLQKRLKHFAKYKVLVIDEIGYLPIDNDSSNLFFQLISERYEKHSTIIITNTPFSDWQEIFGSPVLAVNDKIKRYKKLQIKMYRNEHKNGILL